MVGALTAFPPTTSTFTNDDTCASHPSTLQADACPVISREPFRGDSMLEFS